jgi:subtilase family protein
VIDDQGRHVGKWGDRVRFSRRHGGIAYRPNEVLVFGEHGRAAAERRLGDRLARVHPLLYSRDARAPLFRVHGTFEPLALVEDLRLEGVVAQPNHVLFAHGCGCGCCCPPHPADRCGGIAGSPVYASPVYASPVYASPVYASPVYASPVYASPVYASPVYASTLQPTGHHRSSAVPADGPALPPLAPNAHPPVEPRVVVLDTGLASPPFRPAALGGLAAAPIDTDSPDEDHDGLLDPAAGHGSFIAGLILQLAPGCTITVDRVLSTMGDGDEASIVDQLAAIDPGTDLVNLSFGGYTIDGMYALEAAIRDLQANGRTVVVSSAGNDAVCRPTYPAVIPGVIGVGALGPDGPARFSNYGPWVRACAPGVDLTSTFFTGFNGAETSTGGAPDPDLFDGWAVWSGTSFSAPVVVAALARHMQWFGGTAVDAVARVIDAPGLLRIPDLGTVVNLA